MFEEYLEELNKVELLTESEERGLWERYKNHQDMSARAELIERYQPFVFKLVMKMHSKPDIVLDLIQEATVGLIEATERYNHLKGINFSTYASFRIRGQMINYLQKFNTDTVSLDQAISSDEEESISLMELVSLDTGDEFDFIYDALWQEPIQNAMHKLPPKEKKVIEGIFFENKRPEVLSRDLNMSLAHIYRLQKRAIRRIRGMLSKLKHKDNIS